MNEHIKTILNRVTSERDQAGEGIGRAGKGKIYFLNGDDVEKYAELIIAECARVANNAGAVYFTGDKILKHFGKEK
jgi:hypothetical protein